MFEGEATAAPAPAPAATADATTAAPTASPAPQPGSQEAVNPAGSPKSANEARSSLFQRRNSEASTAQIARAALDKAHHSHGQPRDDVGKFAAPGTEAGQPPAPAVTPSGPAPASPAPAGTTGDPAAPAPEAPAGHVRIPLPAEHPFRRRGMSHVDVPEAEADYHRWAINNAVRRDDVARWEQYAKQQETKAREAEARALAAQQLADRLISDPNVALRAAEIERAFGPEEKKRYLAGVKADQQQAIEQHLQTLNEQDSVRAMEQAADQFIESAFTEATRRFEGWSREKVGNVLAAYGALMDARGQQQPNMEEFLRLAGYEYLQEPGVRERYQQRLTAQQKAEQDRVAKEAAEKVAREQRETVEQATARRREYPLGRLPLSAANASREVPGARQGPQTATEARRAVFGRRRA